MTDKDYEGFTIGPLPVETVTAALGLELEPGDVYCSARVHEKIATKHADDYELFREQVALCLAAPTYIGRPPRHLDKFELVRRIRFKNAVMLLAVTLEKNRFGNYTLASAYTIRTEQVNQRRDAQTLVVAPLLS